MHAATDRLEFAPPPPPGLLRSLGLAVLAHLFLLAALTWGVHWKSEVTPTIAEAELWSAMPQQAAPKLVEVPPEPPEPIAPPETQKTPVTPAPAPPQAQPPLPDANIALEREKLRVKKEKQAEQEKQRLDKQRLEKLKQEKVKQEKLQLEKLEKLEKLKHEKLTQEQRLLEKKRLKDKQAQEKRELEKKVMEDKKKSDQDSKRKDTAQALQDAKKLEAQRKANIDRMTGLAGASGVSTSTGMSQKSSGPSAGYAGRIVERIKSNTTFTDSTAGNPTVLILVRVAASGNIQSRRIVNSSGNKAWDEAVLRAIDKMDNLPRDVDGKIPEKVLSEGLELKVSL